MSITDLLSWGRKSHEQGTCEVLERSTVFSATQEDSSGRAQGWLWPKLVFTFARHCSPHFRGDWNHLGAGRDDVCHIYTIPGPSLRDSD